MSRWVEAAEQIRHYRTGKKDKEAEVLVNSLFNDHKLTNKIIREVNDSPLAERSSVVGEKIKEAITMLFKRKGVLVRKPFPKGLGSLFMNFLSLSLGKDEINLIEKCVYVSSDEYNFWKNSESYVLQG